MGAEDRSATRRARQWCDGGTGGEGTGLGSQHRRSPAPTATVSSTALSSSNWRSTRRSRVKYGSALAGCSQIRATTPQTTLEHFHHPQTPVPFGSHHHSRPPASPWRPQTYSVCVWICPPWIGPGVTHLPWAWAPLTGLASVMGKAGRWTGLAALGGWCRPSDIWNVRE